MVRADPLLLEQAIFNLLDNAVKYSRPGSAIRVHARSDARHVDLMIEDEGTGISPEALPHIFEKFYRAKASDSRIAGTGLGLAVARGFVEASGGRLEAANRTDRSGAVLTISLPIAAECRDGIMAANLPKILIVDDEPQILRFLRASLPPHGYECVEANSGSQAIKTFSKARPDALILDLGLPDQDGFAVIDAVRAIALDADHRAVCPQRCGGQGSGTGIGSGRLCHQAVRHGGIARAAESGIAAWSAGGG